MVARHEIGGRGLKPVRQSSGTDANQVARHEIGGRGLKLDDAAAHRQDQPVARHEIGGRGLKQDLLIGRAFVGGSPAMKLVGVD